MNVIAVIIFLGNKNVRITADGGAENDADEEVSAPLGCYPR